MIFRKREHWLRDEIRTVGLAAVVTIICCGLLAWYFWALVGPP